MKITAYILIAAGAALAFHGEGSWLGLGLALYGCWLYDQSDLPTEHRS